MSHKPKPVITFDTYPISVAVWENAPGKGPRYTVTHSRSYKKDDEWKDSNSYTAANLPALAKLLDVAHSWIVNQSAAVREQAQAA
ncbi:MAG: hypothetical protein ACRELG_07575 [Gemmataceae bacterium]